MLKYDLCFSIFIWRIFQKWSSVYKITEPDGGITIYKDGRTFKKGADGKFYEKKGSAWVEMEDIKTQEQFESMLGEKLDNIQFKENLLSQKEVDDFFSSSSWKEKKAKYVADGYDKVFPQLTPEEGVVIRDYTQEGYESLNDALRGFDKRLPTNYLMKNY